MGRNISPFRKEINKKGSSIPSDEKIRLNKFIASKSSFTRREADKLIQEGKISVNGSVIKELGIKISSGDNVLFNNKPLSPANFDYIIINKPHSTPISGSSAEGAISTDELIKKATKNPLTPINSLSTEASGVQIYTNDAELIQNLEKLLQDKQTIYHLILDRELSDSDLSTMKDGTMIEGKQVKPETLSLVNPEVKSELGMEIKGSSLDTIHKFFKAFNFSINKIDRVYFAGLTKKGLQRGHWRQLKETEIASLKMGSFK